MTTLTEMAKAMINTAYDLIPPEAPNDLRALTVTWDDAGADQQALGLKILLAALRPLLAPKDMKDAPITGEEFLAATLPNSAGQVKVYIVFKSSNGLWIDSTDRPCHPSRWLCTTAQLAEIVAKLGEQT
jgi:hypothetical protein